ncbi:MAG: hypothetical protein L3J69_16730 [Desulfobacula sp.]|nr:hypothetical protein [Desulfobacula sp.]
MLGLVLLISACSDEHKKNDFSGVSDLIASRNKARYDVAKKPSQKKVVTRKKVTRKDSIPIPSANSKKEGISSIVLYEQDIEIVGVQSGRTMAKGVAYVNKKGQIVRIKILRD